MKVNEIGFNDQLEVRDRSLHIQTEVLGKTELKVKTVVLDGGTVMHVTARNWSSSVAVEELQELARVQHEQVLMGVRTGQIG